MTTIVSTNHSCPECGYEWRLDCKTSAHVCPKCSHSWEGGCDASSRDQMGFEIDVQPDVRRSKTTEGEGEGETSHEIEPAREARTIAGRDYSPMHDVARSIDTQEGFAIEFEKPAYRIPSMDEIRAVERNGLRVISTFSGCGGSSLGFRWAGYRSLWSSEFVPEAAETYRANFPDVPLGVQDIRDVEPALLLERFDIDRGDLDVLEGSPPCASFSMAGKRDAHWGEVKSYSDVKQRTDDLLMEYARLLAGLLPRAFVMENVPGLLGGVATGYVSEIVNAFTDAGYKVEAKVIDAQHLGVPQRRKRAIFVGFRRDVPSGSPAYWYPDELSYTYSIRDALPHLRDVALVVDQRSSTFNDNDYVTPSLDEPIATVTKTGVSGDDMYDWRIVPTQDELDEVSIERFAIGREWERLSEGEQSEKYLNLVRPDSNAPLPTVTQTGGVLGAASVTHPSEPRKFTLAELRRLSGFPDDFVLTGTYRQGWERIGRAVPPPMMRAVASRVAEILT